MRAKILRAQMVTVRPLKSQTGDVFGDDSVLVKDTRSSSFRIRMQLTWAKRSQFGEGRPGRNSEQVAMAIVRAVDRRGAGASWIPNTNDTVELKGAAGEAVTLFVDTSEPALPVVRSLRNPDGGFAGWRLSLVDRKPAMSGATEYED